MEFTRDFSVTFINPCCCAMCAAHACPHVKSSLCTNTFCSRTPMTSHAGVAVLAPQEAKVVSRTLGRTWLGVKTNGLGVWFSGQKSLSGFSSIRLSIRAALAAEFRFAKFSTLDETNRELDFAIDLPPEISAMRSKSASHSLASAPNALPDFLSEFAKRGVLCR